MGGMIGIIGNLWTACFLEWLKGDSGRFDYRLGLIITTVAILIDFSIAWIVVIKTLRKA